MHPVLEYDRSEIEQALTRRFETQVRRNPESIAVRDANESLTYDVLNRRANRLAHAILRVRGAAAEPVALLVEHNASAAVAMLAILKAGKFFVPLDPGLPDARLDAILENSQAALLVSGATHQLRAETVCAGRIPRLNSDALANEPDTNPDLAISPDALVNIMYTSGSTGEPKGVVQTHRNVLHAIAAANYPPHGADERVAQLTPFSFGGSTAMLFRTLYFGAALYPFALKQEGLGRLAPFLLEHGITRFHTVPTVLRNWLSLLAVGQTFPALRVLEVGGEPLFTRDLERLLPHTTPPFLVRNAFATTETFIATWDFIDAAMDLSEGVVPVGFPAPDMDALILDEGGQPIARGETGEIVIKSRYLAPGYWRQPAQTAAHFIPVPGEPGVVLYKTGDLGRLRADGALEHLGRRDGMVKIRGNQVVLTFVESAVRALDGIKDAAVIAQPNASGEQRLIAYLVAADPAPTRGELRNRLARTLPEYMIPTTWHMLEQLPRLPNGKLDRRSLPAAQGAVAALDVEYVAPRTPLEEELAQIWREVLGVERVGVHDPFIELGGTSLQASQVIARASNVTGVDVPLSAVFDVPTIQGLSQLITQRMAERMQTQDLEAMLREVEALS